MLLFGKKTNKTNKDIAVQRLLTKIINTKSRALDGLREGPRNDLRADLVLPVMVVPQIDDRPDVSQAFATVTKEISSTGTSLVLTQRLAFDKLFLVIDVEGETVRFRGEVRHQEPLGAGLLQAGIQLSEIVPPGEYPELMTLSV